jgi:hypothetical protein
MTDPLAIWRRHPAFAPSREGAATVGDESELIKRKYEAFTTFLDPVLFLNFRFPKLAGDTKPDKALPYHALTEIEYDGYGYALSLTFSLSPPVFVCMHGEGMARLHEALLKRQVAHIQVFDEGKFFPPTEGQFDIAADEHRGETVVRDIVINQPVAPPKEQQH